MDLEVGDQCSSPTVYEWNSRTSVRGEIICRQQRRNSVWSPGRSSLPLPLLKASPGNVGFFSILNSSFKAGLVGGVGAVEGAVMTALKL